MGARAIKDSFHAYFKVFPNINFWENFENTSEIVECKVLSQGLLNVTSVKTVT